MLDTPAVGWCCSCDEQQSCCWRLAQSFACSTAVCLCVNPPGEEKIGKKQAVSSPLAETLQLLTEQNICRVAQLADQLDLHCGRCAYISTWVAAEAFMQGFCLDAVLEG